MKKFFARISRFCIKYPFIFLIVAGTFNCLGLYNKLPFYDFLGYSLTLFLIVVGATIFNFHINLLNTWLKDSHRYEEYYRELLDTYKKELKNCENQLWEKKGK